MDDVAKWAQFFRVEEHISAWNSEKGSANSLTYWCLKEKKIDSAEYLKWAQSEYLLPTLTEEFFQKSPPKELWLRHTGLWPKGSLPVAEWDGTLFVACLAPIELEQPPQPYQLVLAPPTQLFEWEQKAHERTSVVSTSPEGLSLDESAIAKESTPEGLNFDESAIAKSESPEGLDIDEAKVEKSKTPQGLDLSAPLTTSSRTEEDEEFADSPTGIVERPIEDFGDIDFGTITGFKDERTPPPIKKSEIRPIEIAAYPNEIGDKTKVPNMLTDEEVTQVKLKSTKAKEPSSVDSESTKPSITLKAPHATQPAEPHGVDSDRTKPSIKLEATPATPPAEPQVPEKTGITNAMSDNEVTVTKSFVINAPVVATLNPAIARPPSQVIESSALGEIKIDESFDPPGVETVTEEAKLAYYALANMREFLSRTMFLKLINGQLQIWAWDERWKPAKAAQKLVSVKEPSPFRIVFETQTPYHGYLVENKITHQFFDHWNEGKMPDHMSIVPILDGENLIGMLLGITYALKANRSKLEDVEAVAQKVAEAMKMLSTHANANAA